MHTIPTLIVGGGLAGASVACSLAERENGAGVVVADADVWGKHSASENNAGAVWAMPGGGAGVGADDPAAISMALATQRYYRELGPRVDYRMRGTAWLHGADAWPRARRAAERARDLGVAAVAWEAGEIAEKLPGWGAIGLDDGALAGATYVAGDGWVSAHKLRVHFLNRAQAGGVELMDRWVVTAIDGDRGPFVVRLRRVEGRPARQALSDPTGGAGGDELVVRAERLVNAAGPWAAALAGAYGHAPAAKREVVATVVLRTAAAGEAEWDRMPAVADAASSSAAAAAGAGAGGFGAYVRPGEWDRKPAVVVAWKSQSDRGAAVEREYRERVEPAVVRRLPLLAGAEAVSGWRGAVEQPGDGRAVLGEVPGRPGAFACHGLGDAGLSLARAVGEALAVRLVHWRWPIGLNLEAWEAARFGDNRGA